MKMDEVATALQLYGAFCFGALFGWYLYYINRYRKEDVKLADLVTVIGAVGGGTVLTLFPAKSETFGAYGVGLAVGYFGYFLILLILVKISNNFDPDWFLDGRRKLPDGTIIIPQVGVQLAKGGTFTIDPNTPGAGGRAMGIMTAAPEPGEEKN
jgi:hypothetical protein